MVTPLQGLCSVPEGTSSPFAVKLPFSAEPEQAVGCLRFAAAVTLVQARCASKALWKEQGMAIIQRGGPLEAKRGFTVSVRSVLLEINL